MLALPTAAQVLPVRLRCGVGMSDANTTSESFRAVVARLSHAQKPNKGAPAYSRFVNRPLGRLIAAAAFRAGLTPNQVTAVSAAFSFAAIAMIALLRPVWWLGVLVAACLVIGYAFDAADGQLARLRGGGTRSGEWLDHMIDATKISSLHLAVLISAYRFFDLPAVGWLLVPIGYSVISNVMFFGMILNDQLRRQHAPGTPAVWRSGGSTVRSLLVIPTDYGLLCLVFVLLGASTVFFWVYGLLFLGNAGFMLLAAFKWFRDMRLLDVPAKPDTR